MKTSLLAALKVTSCGFRVKDLFLLLDKKKLHWVKLRYGAKNPMLVQSGRFTPPVTSQPCLMLYACVHPEPSA